MREIICFGEYMLSLQPQGFRHKALHEAAALAKPVVSRLALLDG